MNPQTIKQNIRLYIDLVETRTRLNQELLEICNQKKFVEKELSWEVPEEFIFPYNGKFYRFLMDVEDGGVQEFAEVNFFDVWIGQQESEDLAMDELRSADDVAMDELRKELYSAEILLGGGE